MLGGLTSHPSFVPGPYGNYGLAQARLDRHRQLEGDGALISEQWQFVGNDGAKVELRLAFSDSHAQHLKPPQSRVLSATNPSLRRINQTEVVAQQLQARNTNAVKKIAFTASGPLQSSLFDGSEQLVTIISAPWLVTQVFVP